MNSGIVNRLRCPFCLGHIAVSKVLKGSGEIVRHGLLSCPDCRFEFPIIAGVAILLGPDDFIDIKAETSAQTIFKGPQVADLVKLVNAGEAVKALSLLLSPTSSRGQLYPQLEVASSGSDDSDGIRNLHRPSQRQELRLRRGGRILRSARDLYRHVKLPEAQFRLAEFLEERRTSLSALDVIDLYYRRFSGVETFNYFAFRFGQPRHLAGLSLGAMLARTDGPILDLACGVGHLTHYFCHSFPEREVIGLDRDFFRLFVASEYVAPQATYVCAPADGALPFPDAGFGGIFCSDAFHYFLNRAASVREFSRLLAAGGLLVLSRFGNQAVEPNEGYELTLDGYCRLFAKMPHRFLGEEEIVSNYLEKRGPDQIARPSDALAREKWISVIASDSEEKLSQSMQFADWPHAAGQLQLNPIYIPERSDQHGALDLRFQFPSEWYEFENSRYRDYAPARCRLTKENLQELASGRRSPAIDELLKQVVVLGMPERYATSAISAHGSVFKGMSDCR
jgi:SAM-dependent methyltransferase